MQRTREQYRLTLSVYAVLTEERRVGKECNLRVDLGGRRIIKKIFFKQKTAYEILHVTGVQTCSLPKNYFPAVEKGLQESVQKGPLAAYPVVGVKAVLYDGSYHPVDSSEMAFKMATIQAFKKGFMEAQPVLLEPIASLKVTVPDQYTGDIMGDLNKRRGRVLGMTPVSGGKQVIEADVPMTGLFGYCTDLRSMTGGRGIYSYEFARYEQAPSDVQEKEVAERASKVAENAEA